MSRRPWLLLALAVLVAALIVAGAALYWNYSQDDVYITYRYSRHIATGQGFVFNPGEAVQGTTTPLFALVMAGVYFVTHDLVHAGNLISALSLLGVTLLTFDVGRRLGGAWLGAGAALLLAFNAWFYISFGMETLTYTLLLMAAFWFAYRNRDVAAGVCAGLLTVTRADGILAAAVLGVAALAVRRRIPWLGALTAAVVAGAWYFYAWAAFGSPLPQTFGAKVSVFSGWLFLTEGVSWFRRLYGDGSPLYVLAPIFWLVGIAVSLRKPTYLIVIWAWSLLYVAAYMALNVAAFWYYAPLLPALVLTMGYGALTVWRWLRQWIRSRLALRATASAILFGLLLGQVPATLTFAPAPRRVETYRLVGEWLAANTPAEALILVGDLGVVSWYSNRPTIDVPGLVVPDMHRHSETYAILKYHPDYLVATQYWTWAAILDQPWLARDYRRVVQISTAGDAEFSPMMVFERRYLLPAPGAESAWGEWTARAGLPAIAAWGDRIPITLWAAAPRGTPTDFDWPVCVRATDGTVIAEQRGPFFAGEYPSPTALGAERIADVVWVRLPMKQESATAEVWLGQDCAAPMVRLGTLSIAPPTPQIAGDWQFGQSLRLSGITVGGQAYWAGGEIPVTLQWQAAAPSPVDYSVFVHVLDRSGSLVAQSDAWPDGTPTSRLQPGVMLMDAHAILLPPDLPEGEYRLSIGVYDPTTSVREKLLDGSDSLLVPTPITIRWPGGSGLP